jgi:hypothetical protein
MRDCPVGTKGMCQQMTSGFNICDEGECIGQDEADRVATTRRRSADWGKPARLAALPDVTTTP